MKYKVTYAFDAPCYGSVDIEADSPEDAKARAVEMHKNDTLVREYEANRAVFSDDYRVVYIEDDKGNEVVDWFSLEEGG